MKLTLTLLLICLGLSACSSRINTVSGEEYVQQLSSDGRPMQIDKNIAEIAKVEPNLKFPAQIGVARMINGELQVASAKEAELLQQFADRNKRYGSFAPISMLIAQTIRKDQRNNLKVSELRSVAARQHFDYLLIYKIDVHDVHAKRWQRNNVPRNTIIAQVALIDVRNGYAYAATQTSLNDLKVRLGGQNTSNYKDRAAHYAVEQIMPDIEEIFIELHSRS